MLTSWAYFTGNLAAEALGEGAAISLYLLPLLVDGGRCLMLRFARKVEVT